MNWRGGGGGIKREGAGGKFFPYEKWGRKKKFQIRDFSIL